MAGVQLSPSLQLSLNNLAQTQGAYESAQGQLQTGRAVSSPTDNAIAYFQAASLTARAAQILNYNGGIDQGVSSVDTALTATTAVEGLLKQLQGVVEGAQGGSLAARTQATQQFKAIGTQLSQLVQDASYQGLNLLSSTAATLAVPLSPQSSGSIQLSGYNLVATTGGARTLFTAAAGAFDNVRAILFSNVAAGPAGSARGFSSLDTVAGTSAGTGTVAASIAKAIFSEVESRLSTAINQLQSIASSLGNVSQVLQTRSLFQQSYAASLQAGAAKLTLADLNLAAAHSQASSLRIELGLQSAALQGQIRSSILQILHSSTASSSS
ncbi:MAG: putative flagellin [Rhodospirillales bacterium]|nr:putative flagellin [Rhodospirillales bacterium]